MKSSLLTRQIPLPPFPKIRVDRWLITAFAAFAIAFGCALTFFPEATLQFLMDDPTEPKPSRLLQACAQLFGGFFGILGMPLLLLAPVEDREIPKRIAPALFAAALVVSFVSGSRRPDGSLRRGSKEQIQQAAAQQERNRLARDLHDSIKQQLFSIRVGSAAVEARWDEDPRGAREALRHVRKSAHEAAVEMQALLLQLRPEALATVGLVEALREQCESLGYRTGAVWAIAYGFTPPEQWLLALTSGYFLLWLYAAVIFARRPRQEARRTQPESLGRLLTCTFALWIGPLIVTGASSWLSWSLALLSLGFGAFEAVGFIRRRRARHSADPKIHDALFALLLAVLLAGLLAVVTRPWVTLDWKPVAQAVALALGIPFILWWLRETLVEEAHS